MGFGMGFNFGFGHRQQPAPPPPRPKRENWTIVEKLFSGGQGYTFLVERASAGPGSKRFVLKDLKDQESAQARRRMCKEVAALQALNHSGIPKLIETSAAIELIETKEPFFLVMEFVEGGTLSQNLATQCPPFVGAIDCAQKLLEIADYCHRGPVIHRDIKPKNIVLRNGHWTEPVIIDFGLSFNWGEELPDITHTSEQIGNNFLRLPEQAAGDNDKRNQVSDVTLICGVLLFCLTGKEPTQLVDQNGKKPHQRSEALEKLSAIVPKNQKPALEMFFNRAFAYDIGKRWPTAAEALSELKRLGKEDTETEGGIGEMLRLLERKKALVPFDFNVVTGEIKSVIHAIFRSIQHHFNSYFTFNDLEDRQPGVGHYSLGLAISPKYPGVAPLTIEVRCQIRNSYVVIDLRQESLGAVSTDDLIQFEGTDGVPREFLAETANRVILNLLASHIQK